MNKHEKIIDLLPFYASGTLSANEQTHVKQHLSACEECKAELELWQGLSQVIHSDYESQTAPPYVLSQALESIQSQPVRTNFFVKAWQIIRSQVPLVKKEIWPASLLILVLGFVVTLIADRLAFIYAVAPLVSAAGLAFIYGQEHDPAYELTLSTPISQIQILAARSALVFGYNFVIVTLLSGGLTVQYPADLVLPLMLEWIAPMTFLSTLGLCLSIFSNSGNAIFVSYLLWLGKYLLLTSDLQALLGQTGVLFLSFWQNPAALYFVSACLLLLLFVFVQRSSKLSQQLN
ncbi:MAG: hypothetical protein DWQ07_10150 [Chloroflexi bacterium]|nr:MAG: hypothetical protein DWQ07_10150 [Chloroflexota bacterium]MBL1192928.1 hypothetical protein [Chloroflexota bacterium]NOH10221.1 hypothetical protein [Chloroflexota bacterium]